MLVHGAFPDASGFAGVIRELTTSGYWAVAPPNPLRGLAGDVATVRAVVTAIEGPVLLVGHSYGGAVITQSSDGLDNVIGLVYLPAFSLDVGENCASVQAPFPALMLAATVGPTPYDAPGAVGGPDPNISEAHFRETFCADVPAECLPKISSSSAMRAPTSMFQVRRRSLGWSPVSSQVMTRRTQGLPVIAVI